MTPHQRAARILLLRKECKAKLVSGRNKEANKIHRELMQLVHDRMRHNLKRG